ncbi:maleylpyruvate isomerase N-terminal domain-containing protein [Actinomadura algeriensis]|uniref:Mycothiol-dependent maleylpyruvate isomerase metal-binding domain-containing protein n=1 Tax=Actinomadura algeriensis TaxID=1679523 RepID=A0ABR9JUY0_9ACTN|nr:maleylpyruvate isomerase N-terminal domain-containing protein [Actinomadura algeriensis]MBE1534392.1 hypothetical protein [Actinomadura algeriensis]
MPENPAPVTPDDLDHAVQVALDALRDAPADAWDGDPASLDWTRWETVEHMCNALTLYAVQLGPKKSPMDGNVPFARASRRPQAPSTIVRADPAAGPGGLLQVLESCAALTVAMARVTPPDVRAYHVYGPSDPEGFVAMGVVEMLVHTHDLIEGLGIPYAPPTGVCARVLHRLFPDAPVDEPPWQTLLWATGRADLPGRPRVTEWRWEGTPR